MKSPTVTFCTYTYNDSEFAANLVRQSQLFTIRPDEIVVVDDGSDEPFVMDDAPDSLRVIRLEGNRGITFAKGAGLSAATSDLIFSMDCDTSVNPDWLERNMAHVLTPEVGLVGGALVHQSGDDLVSRYMLAFGDNHNQHHIGPVGFIPGNAFMLRRKTWEEVGGFSGYNQTNCQDHYLCNRLKDKGYTLFSNCEAKAWQQRRVIRTTMCKRVWKWCHRPIKKQAAEADDMIMYLFGTLVAPMLDRCRTADEMEEPLFYYLELLYLAYTVLDMLDYCVKAGQLDMIERDGFLTGLNSLFGGFKAVHVLFKKDMAALGFDVVDYNHSSSTSWNDFFLFAEVLRQGGLMSWLNRQGAVMLMEDDSRSDYHFSSYANADFNADLKADIAV